MTERMIDPLELSAESREMILGIRRAVDAFEAEHGRLPEQAEFDVIAVETARSLGWSESTFPENLRLQ